MSRIICTILFVGFFPVAPGTLASFVALLIAYFIYSFGGFLLLLAFTVFSFIFGLYFISKYISEYHKPADPKEIVIDEVIGQSIPIYMYEIAHGTTKDFNESILFYTYIFILFRFFDIKKPFPINFFDRKFKNSFGVIMDDVIAGFYVVLTLIIFMVIKSKLFI